MPDDLLLRALGILALLGAVAVVALAGSRRRGRLRRPRVAEAPGLERVLAALGPSAAAPRDRPTVVQVSSEYCTPCRLSARSWRGLAEGGERLAFLEVDGARHLDLLRAFGVLTTPTSLVFGTDGRLAGKVTGAPTPARARAALEMVAGHEQMGRTG